MTASATVPPLVADPRPVVVCEGIHHILKGGRCRACGHAIALQLPRCPRCRSEVVPADFGPAGTLWAVTVVHVPPSAEDEVPYTLAYVDLDDGPRLLARVGGEQASARVGARVTLCADSPAGNPTVEVTS
jgi:uncharacterized OB-fold protein